MVEKLIMVRKHACKMRMIVVNLHKVTIKLFKLN